MPAPRLARRRAAAVALCAVMLACNGETPQPSPCEAGTCPGCCDSDGQCHAGSQPAACGPAGGQCVACSSEEACQNGACVSAGCGPTSCADGCCQGSKCLPGTSEGACGAQGNACLLCSSEETCVSGACVRKACDASTCPSGCCYGEVLCLEENDNICGSGGGECKLCKNGEVCERSTHICTPASCGPTTCKGCCDGNGNCVPGAADSACGTGGETCRSCPGTESCIAATCKPLPTSCGPTTCKGCCDATGKCVTTPGPQACGKDGAPCALCASGQGCVDGKCTCTPAACPTGCCDAEQCASGTLDSSCGKGGAPCQKCSATEKCASGVCTSACTPATCIGCCQGNLCKAGSDPSACGKSGGPCKICGPGENCVNGACAGGTTSCTSTTCPAGCCDGNYCAPGTSSFACGSGGKACTLCKWYQLCSAGTCAFDPASDWYVDLVTVKVDKSSLWDSSSDGSINPPDIFVELSVGSQVKTSKTIFDNYEPVFNQYMVHETAANLMKAIKIRVWDWDPSGGHDLICEWAEQFYEWEFTKGLVQIYWPDSCKYVTYVEFDLY